MPERATGETWSEKSAAVVVAKEGADKARSRWQRTKRGGVFESHVDAADKASDARAIGAGGRSAR